MPATLTSVAPESGNPGSQIVLTGTGFAAGVIVTLAGGGQSIDVDCAVVVSATQITLNVPDFGGDALQLSITVQNGDEDPTAAVKFALNQYPPVAALIIPLCGLNAVRTKLGLDPDQRALDETLRATILHASSQMLGVITMDIQPVTITGELYDGDGTSYLELRRGPVQSVSAVLIWGTAVDTSEVKVYPDHIAFEDCGFWNPRLQSETRVFPHGRQNVSVSYVSGFSAIPRDLSDACVEQVIFLRNTLNKQGLLSEQNSQTSSTTQYAQIPLAPHVQIVCNRYRRTTPRAV